MKSRTIINILIVILIMVGIFVATSYYELGYKYVIALELSFIAFILIFILIKRYIQRKRNQAFIKKIISQEKGYSTNNIGVTRENIEQLFLKGIDTLKNSSLKKKYADPVYALPWFCFLGDEDSGKTTFLKNSKLTTSLTDIEFNEVKRNFNWWFFESLVVFDISGRYTQIENDMNTEKEWEHILELVSKYRVKEPLNGMAVTISVDSLLDKDEDTLVNEAIFMRKRINQLMRVVGANFPVYVMVTKFDKLFGSNEILGALDEEILNESFGYINENFEVKSNELFEEKLSNIIDTLNNKFEKLFASSLLDKEHVITNSNQFMNEYEQLNNKLFTYVKTVFRKNEYQYIPKFRGIFYSSSKRDEEISSEYYANYLPNIPMQHSSQKNYFINKFLTKNLVLDRYLFDYLSEFIGWNRVIKNLWLSIFLALTLSASTFTYLSYIENKKVLNEAQKVKKLIVTDDLGVNIKQLYDSYVIVKLMEEQLDQNILKDVGFNYADTAFQNSKNLFIHNFNEIILKKIDNKFSQTLKSKNKLYQDSKYDIVMSYLMLNINVNNELMTNNQMVFNEAYKETTINFLNILGIESLDISYKFLSAYEQYLNWIYQTQALEKRDFILKQQFTELINMKKGDFHWLIRKDVTNIEDITIKDFWPSIDEKYINNVDKNHKVLGAYTKKGKEKIEQYLKTIKTTLEKSSMDINYFIDDFWTLYNKAYINSWRNFLKNFSKVAREYNNDLKNNPMQLLMMTSDNNPYSLVLKYAASELSEVDTQYKKSWIEDLLILNEYILLSKTNNNNNKNKETIMSSIKKELLISGSKVNKDYATKINNSILLADYYTALNDLSFIESDVSIDLQNFFAYNKNNSQLEKTYQILNRFKFKVTNEIKNDFVFDFISGPFYFVLNYALKKEACFLNEEWEKEVLYNLSENDKTNRIDQLFNVSNGYVSNFVYKKLKSYLQTSHRQYRGKIVHDKYAIPFTNDFYTFINRGFKVSKTNKALYNIKIDATPISVNTTSLAKPFRSSIIVDCIDESLVINNLNFKDSKLFKWSANNCSETRIKVSFENFDLIKTYKGNLGFVNFINEVKNGKRKFIKEDFSKHTKLMDKYNISWIDIGFSFKGDINEIINLLDPIPYQVPNVITRCK